MERSIRAVTAATFVLRFATGLTGALLIFFLAELPDFGGPQVGPLLIGGLTALFFAAELIFSPPFGLLSDRVGNHRVMQVGPVFGLIAVVLTALVAEVALPGSIVLAVPFLVGSIPVIALTRVLEGASTAASVPSVLSFIAVATSGDEALRGRASARFEAATIAGLAMGFAAAGPVWELLGPIGFLANGVVYVAAFAVYRYVVPDVEGRRQSDTGGRLDWRRYRRLLRRSRVWLLAPTWIALNAGLGLYTSQTLFQLVREPDPQFADQALVGGFEPLVITAAFIAGGLVFFAGLVYWGGRFDSMRRTTMIFIGVLGGFVFIFAALALNHSVDRDLWFRIGAGVAILAGLFLIAGATPAALGLLADISESFPPGSRRHHGPVQRLPRGGPDHRRDDRDGAAELIAFDGILLASLVLQVVALLPLARLRRFELSFQVAPGSQPVPATVDLSVTRAYKLDAPDDGGGG